MKTIILIYLITFSTCFAWAEQVNKYIFSSDQVVTKIINSNQIYIGVAEEMKGGPFYSQFGHAFLVFANNKDESDDYLVLNFEAKVDAQKLNKAFFIKRYFTYIKASLPVVDIVLTFETLAEKKIRDNQLGQRNIKFNLVNLKYKDLDNLKIQVLKDIDHPHLIGKYSFFSNNCVGAINKLFKQAGIPFEKTILPTKLKNQLVKSGFQVNDDLIVPNQTEYQNNIINPLLANIGLTQDQIENTSALTEIEILNVIQDPQLYYYFYKNDYFKLNDETRNKMDTLFLNKYPDIDLSYFEKI